MIYLILFVTNTLFPFVFTFCSLYNSIEDDFDELLSDVLKKPDKKSPKHKPSPTKKPAPAQRPSPAARTTTTSGKVPPKPAPRKGRPTSTGGTDTVAPVTKDTTSGKVAGAMDDGDILKYIQENAGDSEASLDLF